MLPGEAGWAAAAGTLKMSRSLLGEGEGKGEGCPKGNSPHGTCEARDE